jgi:hypothetical protein
MNRRAWLIKQVVKLVFVGALIYEYDVRLYRIGHGYAVSVFHEPPERAIRFDGLMEAVAFFNRAMEG